MHAVAANIHGALQHREAIDWPMLLLHAGAGMHGVLFRRPSISNVISSLNHQAQNLNAFFSMTPEPYQAVVHRSASEASLI
jgi:hypothetical protein